jgi:ankyrin repeat protein
MDLLDAIRCDGDLERVKLLIDKGNTDVNYEDWTGKTALFWAINYGHISICRLLLDLGADVNYLTKNESTPLMYAVYDAQIEIIKLLLSRGANVHIKNSYGHTALDFAFKNYDFNVVRILYWRGAKCRNTNINGVLLFIYSRILPVDQLREIHTKWIS